MPNFNANVVISNNAVKVATKGRIIFLASKPTSFLKTGIVINFRPFVANKLISTNSTITVLTPTVTRTVGQLFP